MTTTTGAPLSLDPRSYEYHADPYPRLRRLRDEAPVYRNDELGIWALTRYDDVRDAVHDCERYSSSQGVSYTQAMDPPNLIFMDPPHHTRLRSLVSRAFTPKGVSSLEPRIRSLSAGLLDPHRGSGAFDVIERFTKILPMAVISYMLDVPDADQPLLRNLVDRWSFRDENSSTGTEDAWAARTQALDYIAELIAERRGRPGDDVVSALIEARDGGEALSEPELRGFVLLLLIAGYETTAKLLGSSIFWLNRFPGERARILADPSLSANALEELIRYDGPASHMFRNLTVDVEVRGTTMAAGDRVMLVFASANRDERRWNEPDRVDVTRDTAGHFGLGHGAHFCLGASLARLEARIGLEEFLRRFPDYDVDEEGAERAHTNNLRGFSRLPISGG